MTIPMPRVQKLIQPLVGSIAALLLCGQTPASAVAIKGAGDTWVANPVDGNWYNSSNWVSNTIPNSTSAVATFNKSTITSISVPNSSFTTLDSTVFNSGASSYTISVGPFSTLRFFGAGVVNNSGKTQNFLIASDGTNAGAISFFNSSSAGKNTVFTVMGGADGGEGGPGRLSFNNSSNAGQATLIALGGAPATSRPIISAFFSFFGPSFLTTGGGIDFNSDSQGGQATIKLYGNGFLDISSHNPGTVTIGSLEGNGLVFLGSNNLAIGSNNQDTVFSGVIQDGGEGGGGSGTGGSLTKVGTGKLTLNGVNTYTGNTYIDGGTLIVNGSIASPFTFVNPGGTLGGHGIIGGSVFNNGIVSPGNSPGTLTVNGNYTQTGGGNLLIQVASPSVFDHLIVGGSANLNGTITIDALDPSKLKKGQTFEFLTAAGGVHGVFSKVENEDNGTLIRFKVKYGSDDVFLKTYVAPFTSLTGLTPNEQAVANILNKLTNDKDANNLINFLATQPIGNLPGDFDKLAAEEFTSIFNISTSFDNVQSLSLQSYLDSLRSGTGYSAGGLALNGFSVNYAGPINFRTGAAGPNGDDGKSSKEVQQVAPSENRWGAFLTGTGQWVGVSDDFNAKGYDVATGGFTLGVDYKVCSHFAVGIMAGYVGSSVDTGSGGRVLVNGGKLGLYATAFQNRQPAPPTSTGMSKDSSKESKEVVAPAEVDPGWYADVAVVGGYSSYDMHRAGLEGTARGDTDGGDLNVLFGGGYDFKRGNFTFGPTASFNYTYVGVSSFTETGSLAPLHIDSQGQESIRTAFGMKASYDWKLGGLMIKPELRAAWQHEYGDNTFALNSSFADGNAGNFTVWGPRIGRDSLLVGAGFAIQLNERMSTYFYYDGELARTRYDSHSVTGGVRVAF